MGRRGLLLGILLLALTELGTPAAAGVPPVVAERHEGRVVGVDAERARLTVEEQAGDRTRRRIALVVEMHAPIAREVRPGERRAPITLPDVKAGDAVVVQAVTKGGRHVAEAITVKGPALSEAARGARAARGADRGRAR